MTIDVDQSGTRTPGSTTAHDALVRGVVAQVESSLHHLRCAAVERLVRLGVTMTHLQILSHLEDHGEIGMGRIADLIGVSMSNASGLIDRMEERGLVERVRLTDDRRVVHVRTTPLGLEMLNESEILRADLMTRILDRLDDQQLKRLARTVDDLRAALQAEPAVTGAHGCPATAATDSLPELIAQLSNAHPPKETLPS